VGNAPRGVFVLGGGARSFYGGHIYFERNVGSSLNIYFGRQFFDSHTKLALFCNLNFTKVCITL
jgi:hypothetical protein